MKAHSDVWSWYTTIFFPLPTFKAHLEVAINFSSCHIQQYVKLPWFPPIFPYEKPWKIDLHQGSPGVTRGHQVPSNSARQVTWAQYQESTRARTEQDRFAAMTQDETRAMAGGWRKGTRWGMAIFFFFPELLSIWIYSDLMGFNGIL